MTDSAIQWIKTTPEDIKTEGTTLISTGYNRVLTSEKTVSQLNQGIVFQTHESVVKIHIGIGRKEASKVDNMLCTLNTGTGQFKLKKLFQKELSKQAKLKTWRIQVSATDDGFISFEINNEVFRFEHKDIQTDYEALHFKCCFDSSSTVEASSNVVKSDKDIVAE